MQESLRADALNEYIRHNGTAMFAAPPGVGTGGFVGDTLFTREQAPLGKLRASPQSGHGPPRHAARMRVTARGVKTILASGETTDQVERDVDVGPVVFRHDALGLLDRDA